MASTLVAMASNLQELLTPASSPKVCHACAIGQSCSALQICKYRRAPILNLPQLGWGRKEAKKLFIDIGFLILSG